MRRVGLEELTAKTPEPAHDFNLVFRPGGPASKCRWREPPVGLGGSFFLASPGALLPRQE